MNEVRLEGGFREWEQLADFQKYLFHKSEVKYLLVKWLLDLEVRWDLAVVSVSWVILC